MLRLISLRCIIFSVQVSIKRFSVISFLFSFKFHFHDDDLYFFFVNEISCFFSFVQYELWIYGDVAIVEASSTCLLVSVEYSTRTCNEFNLRPFVLNTNANSPEKTPNQVVTATPGFFRFSIKNVDDAHPFEIPMFSIGWGNRWTPDSNSLFTFQNRCPTVFLRKCCFYSARMHFLRYRLL